MPIRQRSGRLQIDVQYKGTRHREYFDGTLIDAQAREAQIRADLQAGASISQPATSGSVCPKSSSMALEAALEATWQRYWSEGGCARTVRSNMKTCIEFFGADTDIREITTEDADRYIEYCKGLGLSVSTIKQKCHPMVKMYTHYTRRGNITKPPFFETPKAERNYRTRVITEAEMAEVRRLFNDEYDKYHGRGDSVAGCDWADFFTFLWDVGCRPSEAQRLTRQSMMGESSIYLAKTKTNNPRTVPMTSAAKEAFLAQCERHGDQPFVWATKDKAPKAWQWVREHIGLGHDDGFITYALRHTCATRLYDKTRDLMLVQKWLGHTNIQTTMRYAKLQPHDLDNARDLLEAA